MLKLFSSKTYGKISFVGLGNFFNTFLGFLFLTAVARSLPLENFGKYALLTNILIFTAKITDFGTNSTYVATSLSQNGKKDLEVFYSAKIILLGISIILGGVVLTLLGLKDPLLMTLFLLGLTFYCGNFILYALFQENENYLMLVLLNSIMAGIKGLAAIFIFLNILKINLPTAFGIFSLSVIPSLFLVLLLPQGYGEKISLLSLKKGFVFVRGTFFAGFSQMLNEGWSAISNSIAKIMGSFSDAGIYSLADKLATIFSLVSFSIFTVLLPKNAKRKLENKSYDFKETGLIALGVFLLAFVGMAAARIILVPLFGKAYEGSLAVIDILLLSYAILAVNTFMENYFYVEKKTKLLFGLAVTKLGVFLAFSIVFVPVLSLTGLAYAQLFAGIITFVGFVITMASEHRKA